MPLGRNAHTDSQVSGVVQVAEHLGAESFVYMDVGGHGLHRQGEFDVDVIPTRNCSVGIPAGACCSMPGNRRSRAPPNIYPAPDRGQDAEVFPFFMFSTCLLPVARPAFDDFFAGSWESGS